MSKSKITEEERMIECFFSEIKNQCEYVFMSVDLLNNSLKSGPANFTFYALQNMFTALGNISKILYPTKNYRNRGKVLRERLGIKDESQFFYNDKLEVARKYRNILEHYDEYFEDWYREGENNYIIDGNVGPKDMIKIENQSIKYLRHYDSQYHKFIFLDNEYNIIPVIEETKELYEKINKIESSRFDY